MRKQEKGKKGGGRREIRGRRESENGRKRKRRKGTYTGEKGPTAEDQNPRTDQPYKHAGAVSPAAWLPAAPELTCQA